MEARKSVKGLLDEPGIARVLREATVGHLATVGPDGRPYVVPVNFVELEGRIYVHGPGRGRKIENIAADPRVCFEAAVEDGFLRGPAPCDTAALFRSVVAEGEARLAGDPGLAVRVLTAFTRKYAPEHPDPGFEADRVARTHFIEVTVIRWTGRFRK
jgi:nitroimidazol reductase NimA-like FMN-containing flavoprotein (pyridoxamine 5'-phosphate oxidase superfamily)